MSQTSEQYIAIYSHVSSKDATFQPVTDPRLINITKLEQPYISVAHLGAIHLKISWVGAIYRERNRHAAILRRQTNTGMP
jgi:hypothetical protein